MLSTLASGTQDTTAKTLEQDVRPSFRQQYHEITQQGRHVVEADVIEQLRSNIAQLEDMHGRMRFMMTELSYLLKKS